MAMLTYTNAYIAWNSTALSTNARSITLNYEVETQDNTTMGDTTHSVIPSLYSWSVDATLAQDFISGGLDGLLFSHIGPSTAVYTLEIRPTGSAVSTSNPKYSGNAMLSGYNPVSGSVGDFAEISLKFMAAKTSTGGAATLTRATA